MQKLALWYVISKPDNEKPTFNHNWAFHTAFCTMLVCMVQVPNLKMGSLVWHVNGWFSQNARSVILLNFVSSYFKSHCVKSVLIRSFFWSVFSCIRTEYLNLRIHSEYRKIRARKNYVFGYFHAVICKGTPHFLSSDWTEMVFIWVPVKFDIYQI